MDGMPPEVISGSGGALLDETIYPAEEPKSSTKLARGIFGFVGVLVADSVINLTFYSVDEDNFPKATFAIEKKK